jgi:hypothetical protein
VTIRTATGAHTMLRNVPAGSPDQPLSDAELQGKLDTLVGPVLATLSRLESVKTVSGLLPAS